MSIQVAMSLSEGKALAEQATQQFGGVLSDWEPTKPGTLGQWEYTNFTLDQCAIRLGVSGGGVVWCR